MTLTKRGNRVLGIAFIAFMLSALALAGRFDALDQCAEYASTNNYNAALDAGCSFDALPNGEYPYTWKASK
jgi:hypothetical protein